jgi:hypothetical protein
MDLEIQDAVALRQPMMIIACYDWFDGLSLIYFCLNPLVNSKGFL